MAGLVSRGSLAGACAEAQALRKDALLRLLSLFPPPPPPLPCPLTSRASPSPTKQATDARIATSVRQLDLRSVQATGADKRRAMLGERKLAMSAMSSVPHPVSPPGARPSTAASPLGGRVGVRSPHTAVSHEEAYAHVTALVAAERVGAEALEKVTALEASLARTCAEFAGYVSSTETLASPYYVVSFAAGPIGAQPSPAPRAYWALPRAPPPVFGCARPRALPLTRPSRPPSALSRQA